MQTPWGKAQTTIKICDGLYSVSTASHGGYMVSKALADEIMPGKAINRGFLGKPFGDYYCYEEDCAWCAVAIAIHMLDGVHPVKQAFINSLHSSGHTFLDMLDNAYKTAEHYYPELTALNVDYSDDSVTDPDSCRI